MQCVAPTPPRPSGFHQTGSHRSTDPYGRLLAATYDPMAALYSGGAIGACKRWGVDHLQAGSRALFAGAGSAADVVEPARGGVTCELVDTSWAMLDRARDRLDRCGLLQQVTCHAADVRDLRLDPYDAIVAHFFLNIFDATTMPGILGHLLSQLRPQGQLIIGDFATASGSRWQRGYHNLPMHLFAAWTDSQPHLIHDISTTAHTLGARLVETRSFRVARVGPAWFASWVFTR